MTLRVLESATRYGKSAKRIAMKLLKRIVLLFLILSFLTVALVMLKVLPLTHRVVW
jgi:hypothetical protein